MVHFELKCLTGAKGPGMPKALKPPGSAMGRRIGSIGGDQVFGGMPWGIVQVRHNKTAEVFVRSLTYSTSFRATE